MPVSPRAQSRPLSNLHPVAFLLLLLLILFLICEKRTQGQTQPTAPVVRGTLQIKRGMTLMEMLMSGQMFMLMPTPQTAGSGMDACDFDLYIGTPYGNRRIIQRFYTGNGAPGSTSSRGAILDMYFDKTTGLLYQKTAAGWGTGTSLIPNITMGTVSTLAAGATATASITGTMPNPILNLGIPRGATGLQGLQGLQGIQGLQGLTGADGITPNISVGTVTPSFTGAVPTVTRTGTNANPVFNFTFAASPYTFMADIPAIALAEINTNKSVTLTFPTAFPGTNYVYYVQFVSTSGGLLNTITWTQGAKTAASLTLNVRSTVAVAGGSAQAWVMVAYKNAP